MNLLRSFSIYTLATFINRGIGFLLTPVLTFFLTREDMGILSLFSLYLVLMTVLIGLGGKGAVSVRYFQLEAEDFRTYFSSALAGPLSLFVILLVVIWVMKSTLSAWLGLPAFWLPVLVLAGLFQVLNELCLTWFRVTGAASRFAWFSIALTAVNMALSLGLVIALRMGWEGRAAGIAMSYGMFFLVSLFALYRARLLTFRLRPDFIKAALIFGIPLVPHLIGSFTIEFSDKIFIEKMRGAAELGLYDVGYKVGTSIQFLVTAFFLSFGPWQFETLENLTPYKRTKMLRLSYFFIVGLGLAVILLSVLAPWAFRLIIDDNFYHAHRFVFWVAASYFFYGTYSVFANYIHYSGKTWYFSILALFNIGINLILNYFLILRYGAMGAAYATLISYFILFLLTAMIAHRLNPMPWLDPEIFNWRDIRRWGRDAWSNSGRS